MTNYIYALSDPISNSIRYIGKTDNLYRRYQAHLIDKSICHRTNWIQSLLKENYKPNLIIIEILTSNQDWEEREMYWIEHYKNIGYKLTNGTNGGDNPPDCTGYHLIKSEQGRKNIIAALIKRNKSPEMRAIVSKTHKGKRGKKNSPEEIARKSKWMKGRKHHTDEFKKALAKRNKSRIYNSEIMRQNANKLWQSEKGLIAKANLIERNKARTKNKHT